MTFVRTTLTPSLSLPLLATAAQLGSLPRLKPKMNRFHRFNNYLAVTDVSIAAVSWRGSASL